MDQAAPHYLPGRLTGALVIAATAACWFLVFGGFVGIVAGVLRPIPYAVVILVVGTGLALWLTRWAARVRRVRAQVPAALLDQRRYGDLTADPAADTPAGTRSLRPIAVTAAEVAARTDRLLGELTANPSVRIFRAVRAAGSPTPVTHAVSAGRLLILVESVAWPPGRYQMDATGRVRCDGRYIGQSTSALVAAVHGVRRRLPRTHRVSALVVVHRTDTGGYALPPPTRDLSWTLADESVRELGDRLDRQPRAVSRHTVGTLTQEAMT
jgi:hypothetical protein